jgi:hypothetical protein
MGYWFLGPLVIGKKKDGFSYGDLKILVLLGVL